MVHAETGDGYGMLPPAHGCATGERKYMSNIARKSTVLTTLVGVLDSWDRRRQIRRRQRMSAVTNPHSMTAHRIRAARRWLDRQERESTSA